MLPEAQTATPIKARGGRPRVAPRRRRKRGIPPPTFKFSELDDEQGLNTEETAAVVRKTVRTLLSWPPEKLFFTHVDGFRHYKAKAIRAYLNTPGEPNGRKKAK